MNDFTKEELEHIHEILISVCEEWHEPNATYELRDKIKSIIDNYCEHDLDMADFVSDYLGKRWNECKKCKGYYNLIKVIE